MPEVIEGDGFRANLRRPVQSPSFTETFGDNMWKAYYTPADDIGRLIPQGKMKSSGKRIWSSPIETVSGTNVLRNLSPNGIRFSC
jgi:hypothetical protein